MKMIVGSKVQPQLNIFDFLEQISTRERYFGSKTKKMSIIIESFRFELV